MKAASCFSGIGAPELGGPQFDWVWCAEVEKFPSAVLAERFPHSVNLGDVTADDFLQRASAFGPLDLLVGGPPCQDFSVAGLRAGVAGDRGNLSLRFMEIAHAIRPRNLLVENVPGWLNMPDNAFGSFLGGLVGADDALRSPLDGKWPSAGMVAGPRARAAWRVFDAQYFGVAQRRRRVFVVADFGEGADPAAVLFERQGVSGNSPPRREAGQGTAGDAQAGAGSRSHWDGDYPHPTLNQSTGSSGGVGASNQEIFSQRGAYLVGSDWPAEIAGTLDAHYGDKMVLEDQHVFNQKCSRFVADRPVAFAHQGGGTQTTLGFDPDADTAMTLQSHQTPAIAFQERGRIDGRNVEWQDDLAYSLNAPNGGGRRQELNIATEAPVAWSIMPQNSGKDFKARQVEVAQPVMAAGPVGGNQGGDYIQQAWQVRRLTPTECERLQSFPDGFTDIEYRGKPAADGPRYKALGNSWARVNGAWIIARIADQLATRLKDAA